MKRAAPSAMSPAEAGQVVWDILEQSGQPWAAVLSRLASNDVWRDSAGALHETLMELQEAKEVEHERFVELHVVANAPCLHGLRIFVTRMNAMPNAYSSLYGSEFTLTGIRYRIVSGAMPRIEVVAGREVLEEIPLLHPRLALYAVRDSKRKGERSALLDELSGHGP